MKKNYLLYAFIAVATSLGFSSCSSEDVDEVSEPQVVVTTTRTMLEEDEINDLEVFGEWTEDMTIPTGATEVEIPNWVIEDDGGLGEAAAKAVAEAKIGYAQEYHALPFADQIQALLNLYPEHPEYKDLEVVGVLLRYGKVRINEGSSTVLVRVYKTYTVSYADTDLVTVHNGGSLNH